MLTLVGMGLSDEKDMTVRGIEAASSADAVYCELYTGKWSGSVEGLEKAIGRQVSFLKRSDLEDGMAGVLSEAKEKDIVILIQGDPMVATTHSSLLVEARKMGIETKIVHNSSIFSAVAETGLHVYKFGATVTIPFLEKTMGRLPKSVYDSIRHNKSRGLHTLCLLDIGPDASHFMTPTQAVDLLLAMERQFGEGVIGPSEKIVVLSNAGSQKSRVLYEEIESLQAVPVTDTPSVIVIPGKTHFTEEELLAKLAEKPAV